MTVEYIVHHLVWIMIQIYYGQIMLLMMDIILNLILDNKEQFNNKLELELGKKDLELENVKNKLENLQYTVKVNKIVK
jgi:hypothetical protein